MLPAAAIFSAHPWAKEERLAFTVSAGRPFEERKPLMSETNSLEVDAEAGVAGINTARDAIAKAAMARMRNFKMPPGQTHGGRSAPFGSPAALRRKLLVGPLLCVLSVSRRLPFRGMCQDSHRRFFKAREENDPDVCGTPWGPKTRRRSWRIGQADRLADHAVWPALCS